MKIKYFLGLLPAIFFLIACNSSNENEGDVVCLDIVTLESNGDAGSVFTVQQSSDSPLITLLSKQQLDPKDYTVGSRVIIQYIPANNQPYTSGNISILAASNTLGGGKAAEEGTAVEFGNWSSSKIDARTIWRTGKYLNLQFQAESAGDPKEYKLVFDKSTLDSDYPTAHFIFQGTVGSMAQTYVFYASYDISAVWNRDIKGIKVLYKDRNSVSDLDAQVTLIKEKSELTPIE